MDSQNHRKQRFPIPCNIPNWRKLRIEKHSKFSLLQRKAREIFGANISRSILIRADEYVHFTLDVYRYTDPLNLKMLRSQVLNDFLVGLNRLRNWRSESVEYTLDCELLHRVCQMRSTTRKNHMCNRAVYSCICLSVSRFAPSFFSKAVLKN